MNLFSLSLRLFTMPAKCGWSALKARLARELLPEGLENFRKALKATSGKFKDVWLVFQGQHGRFFLQAVAPKTAQVSRAEKNGRRFPTTNRFSVKQSWYWYELRNYLTEFIFIINL